MEERWARLAEWVGANAPAVESGLRPPATDAEIEDAEDRLGVSLPPSVRRSYLVHDGEADTPGGVLGHRLLPLAEVVETTESLRGIDEDFEYDFWGDSLVPVCAVGNGDYLCVSDAPTGEETALLRWDHERSAREELEPSFAAYVDTVLDALDTGDYEYDAERGRLRVDVSVRRR